MLTLEVKDPDGDPPTPLQWKEMDEWCQAGAIAHPVWSVDDVKALIANLPHHY